MNSARNALLVGLLVLVVAPLIAGTGAKVVVTNPSKVPRKGETVELKMADLLARGARLTAERIGVRDDVSGKELVVQVSDGFLLFQSDFAPGQKKTFVVHSGEEQRDVVPKVDGYFALPREDYAWENDRIAFRMYGPALAAEVSNGIDVWTKRVRGLIVRKWYEADAQSGTGNYYHTDRGEGADFFAVGRTLGAGGSGIWYKDSLYQPGVFSACRMRSNGPIRTTFELAYDTWNVQGKKFTEIKRISLDAGRNLNNVEVLFTGMEPGDSLLIACGLVKRKNVTVHADEQGSYAALWGPTNDDPANGSLGTGILMDRSSVVRKFEDSTHVLLLGRIAPGQPFRYRAGAGWTRSGDFSDAAAWYNYLKEESIRNAEPLQVSITPDHP